MNTRETSNSIYLCPCISPLATWTRTENPSPAKTSLSVAIGDYGLFFTSGFHRLAARWLLSKPPKLEATKRHPVGHPELRFPWPTHFVAHPDTAFPATRLQLSLVDKLVPRRSSSNPFLARWEEAGGGASGVPGSTARHRPEGPHPGGSRARVKNGQGPLHRPWYWIVLVFAQKQTGLSEKCTKWQMANGP
jgi:hypothetical protein